MTEDDDLIISQKSAIEYSRKISTRRKESLMDVENKYFIIHKHWKRRKGARRRRFYEEGELQHALDRARKYADENNEDYLIVRVVAEQSKPLANASPLTRPGC